MAGMAVKRFVKGIISDSYQKLYAKRFGSKVAPRAPSITKVKGAGCHFQQLDAWPEVCEQS
jgi:hypothetical protein